MHNLFIKGKDYIYKRWYLHKAKKIGEPQSQFISKDRYLEENEEFKEIESLVIKESTNEEHEIVEIEITPNKIICPDCGGITYEGLEFCHKCGWELETF